MSQVKLNVKLLEMTPRAISIIYAAYRQCYSSKFAGNIFANQKEKLENEIEFIRKVVETGHESPLEHVNFTFAIEGISRALTHQLVRHRIASFSQQSQRYVKEINFDYIIPPSIEEDKELKEEFIKIMDRIQISYNSMLEKFKAKGRIGEKANEDARFILPQAIETKIIMTMNCRELLHFFKQRCCSRAQWEIRELANKMLEISKNKLPVIFSKGGAKCIAFGYCPEGKFTCGKYPLKEKIISQNK